MKNREPPSSEIVPSPVPKGALIGLGAVSGVAAGGLFMVLSFETAVMSVATVAAMALVSLPWVRMNRRAWAAKALLSGRDEQLDTATRRELVQLQRALDRAQGNPIVGGSLSLPEPRQSGETSLVEI